MPVTDFPLGRLSGAFTDLLDLLQDADVAPSSQASAASTNLQTALTKAKTAWSDIHAADLLALNAKLRQANLPTVGD